MAPELLKGESYSHAVDWWALGVLFYELLAGQTPFCAKRPREMFAAILRADPPPLPEAAGAEAAAVARGLLAKRADERLGTSTDVAAAPFFRDVDWAALADRRTRPPHAPRLPPYFQFSPAGVLSRAGRAELFLVRWS